MNVREAYEQTMDFLRQRKQAYQRSFLSKARVRSLRKAYQRVFLGEAGQMVLQDMAKFCRASESVMDMDDRKTFLLIGRNEVWLRIMNHLNLTVEEIYTLSGGRNVRLTTLQEDDDI